VSRAGFEPATPGLKGHVRLTDLTAQLIVAYMRTFVQPPLAKFS